MTMLTVAQAAVRLGKSPRQVRRDIEHFPGAELHARLWLIPESAIERYQEWEREQAATRKGQAGRPRRG